MTDKELKTVLTALVSFAAVAATNSTIAATDGLALTTSESKAQRERIAFLNIEALKILGVEVPGIE